MGAPLGSPSLLHSRPGPVLSRGRGMVPPHGGRHFGPGRFGYSNPLQCD
jgi:hypothetical protein